MPYLGFVLVSLQSIVHELEEVGSYHQIVFQNDDSAVFIDLGRYTIDDVPCQSPVLASFDNGDVLESIDGTDVVTHFVYSCLLVGVLGTIGIDEEFAFSGTLVFTQGFYTSLGV